MEKSNREHNEKAKYSCFFSPFFFLFVSFFSGKCHLKKLGLVAFQAERDLVTVSLHVKQQPCSNKGFFFSILILECI